MKATELNGMRVVDVESAQTLGEVGDVMLDLDQQRLTDLVLRGGVLGGGGKLVPSEAIEAIGPHAVTVQRSRVPESGQPHAGGVPLSRVQGNRVLAEDGTQLGSLRDINFDPNSYRITAYLYTHGGFAGLLAEQRDLPVDLVRRASAELIVASREALAQAREAKEK